VYKARDTGIDREVAIKIVAELFSQLSESEGHAIATLNHPYIYVLHDIGPNYLVMEYIEGESLEARINQEISLADLNLSGWCSRLSSMAHIRPRFGN
jgi:eukaryotic-like serine/threonine-protein kinase